MTPQQRERLAAVERRGWLGLDGQRMVETMRQIDERRTRAAAVYRAGQRHQQAKAVWWGELIGACVVIAIFLAVAFFVGTGK